MAALDEGLLHPDATLLEDVADPACVREPRGAPHLGGKLGEPAGVLGQRACPHDELGACAQWVVVGAVDLREERQAAQLGLANGVEVVGAVALGVELAKQVGEHADVGELLI